MAILEDELGDIVAKARVGQGLTVEKVALAVGARPQDIQRIESYHLKPDAETVRELARVLELEPQSLLEAAAGSWTPREVALQDEAAVVERVEVPTGRYIENSYIVGCRESGLAGVVDPGGAAERISERLNSHGLKLAAILVTHAHPDHIGGIRALAATWPTAKLINHQLERDSITRGLTNVWEPAKDNIGFYIGKVNILPLFTPGHTPGSMCYCARSVCFVGDTLFAGSIGRPSSPTVYQQMLSAVSAGVLSMPDDTILLPGHGPATTVGEEKAHNPFFARQ